MRTFDWCQNQRPWMTWKAIMHPVSKHVRLSEPTTKIWMKIDPYYQRQRCSPITLVSGKIRFMRIFAGIPWRGASDDSAVIENVNFQGFRTLRLRHLRKWGQHYYIVLISPLSPFTDPKMHDLEWPWMAVKFSLTNRPYLINLFYILTVESIYTRDQRRCTDCRSGPWSAEYLGSAEKLLDATSSEP